MTPDFSDDFRQKERNLSKKITRKWKIRVVIVLLHILGIGIPLLWEMLHVFFSPPKVNAFRVKIGPSELSTAPEVGPPERTRPGNGAPAIPREPEVKIPARPKKQITKKAKPVKKRQSKRNRSKKR